MTTLWLAFGIYIIGVAIVLFVRPNVMFRPGSGSWREFGLSNTGSVTVFPFWMFTLVWAIISYAVATLGTIFIASTAMRGTVIEENVPEVSTANFIPASKMKPNVITPPVGASGLPGYYILDTSAPAPKYVYFGSHPPTLANLS